MAQPEVCSGGGARNSEGPLTSQGPHLNFKFLHGFRPLYFENIEKMFFFVKCCRKSVKVSVEGPLTTQGSPNFNSVLRFRPLHLANMIKRCAFVKFCRKKTLKFRPYSVPDVQWGGTCPLCPLPWLRHCGGRQCLSSMFDPCPDGGPKWPQLNISSYS